MQNLYFFVSSNPKDEVKRINVFTTSYKKAYAYACKIFAQNNCKGEPTIIAI